MDATMVPQNIQDRNVKNYPVKSCFSPGLFHHLHHITQRQVRHWYMHHDAAGKNWQLIGRIHEFHVIS